jgi:hypothetical protein
VGIFGHDGHAVSSGERKVQPEVEGMVNCSYVYNFY